MKYKVNDRVRIKSIDWYNENKNPDYGFVYLGNGICFYSHMSIYCGKTMTISEIVGCCYVMAGCVYDNWTDEMIEGLVEEETLIERVDDNGLPFNEWLSHKGAFYIPEDYVLKDENGNEILTSKIILEKKKKDVNLTQEQIDTMVHESCVLFCKHCGCGVPRETCTSLGTCKEYDDYRKSIRTHFEKHKK